MHYVYILKSDEDGKLYVGCTSDLKKRLLEHNQGRSQATRHRRPLKLIYYEAYLSLSDARKRETRLKGFKNSYKELRKRIESSLRDI